MDLLELKHSIADEVRKPTQIEQALIEMVEDLQQQTKEGKIIQDYWHDMYVSQNNSMQEYIRGLNKQKESE